MTQEPEQTLSEEQKVQTPSFIRGITLVIGGMLTIIAGYAFFVLRFYVPQISGIFGAVKAIPIFPLIYVILGAYLMGIGFRNLRGFWKMLTEQAKLSLEQQIEEQREDETVPVDETLAEKRP